MAQRRRVSTCSLLIGAPVNVRTVVRERMVSITEEWDIRRVIIGFDMCFEGEEMVFDVVEICCVWWRCFLLVAVRFAVGV